MGIWDKHIIPFVGNTLGDIIGPWQTTKPVQEKVLRSGAGLASLFTKPISSVLGYVPEAQATLFPIHNKVDLPIISKLLKRGASPEDLRKQGYVFDGKQYNKFEPDTLNEASILKALRGDTSGGEHNLLRNFMTNPDPRFRAVSNSDTRMNRFLGDDIDGSYSSGGKYTSGRIDINSERPFSNVKDAILHEGQHAVDDYVGRSFGAEGTHPQYWTERGEVRARLNELLNKMSTGEVQRPFKGLQDVVESISQYPKDRGLIWDNMQGVRVNNN